MARNTTKYTVDNLKIIGFPRSGTTFLFNSLNKMYPNRGLFPAVHTVWELEDWIEQGNVPLVALREPLDCIASWSVYRTEGKFYEAYTEKNLEYDVNFYIRLMSSVLNHKDNILFFDFNKFIEDLTYVKNAIVNLTNENPVEEPTAQEVHNYMKNHPNFYLNVPRETKTIIEANKPLIQKIHNFVDAQEIYNQLMQVEAMQFKE